MKLERRMGEMGRPGPPSTTGESAPPLRSADQSEDAHRGAAESPASGPAPVPLSLAPLQRVAPYQKWHVAEYLTFTEAANLMSVSRDMRTAMQTHPLLKLRAISDAFQARDCEERAREIRALDAELLALRSFQQGKAAAGAQSAKPPRAIALAGRRIELSITHRNKAARAQDLHLQTEAGKREQSAKSQQRELSQSLDADIENVIFHFSSARVTAPISRGFKRADPTGQAIESPDLRQGRLHQAIYDGRVTEVRSFLREYLELASSFMPSSRKVAWLLEHRGLRTLAFFGQYPCGSVPLREQRRADAIRVYVDEIVSSPRLSPQEKRALCVKLPQTSGSQGAEAPSCRTDIVRHAVSHNNPAVAAAILLGIHESLAERELKNSLLEEAASSWAGGLKACVAEICGSLRALGVASNWINGVVGQLERVEPIGIQRY